MQYCMSILFCEIFIFLFSQFTSYIVSLLFCFLLAYTSECNIVCRILIFFFSKVTSYIVNLLFCFLHLRERRKMQILFDGQPPSTCGTIYNTIMECLVKITTKIFKFSKNATNLTLFLSLLLNLFISVKNTTVTSCSWFKSEISVFFSSRA